MARGKGHGSRGQDSGGGLTQFPGGTDYDAGARQTSQRRRALANGWTVPTKGTVMREGQDGCPGPQGQDTHLAVARLGARGSSVVWAMSPWDPGW